MALSSYQIIVAIFLVYCVSRYNFASWGSVDPEYTVDELKMVQLVHKHGYPIETHRDIKTEDGYLLDIHRIPYGRNNSDQFSKPPVLLMHGIFSSSADWVTAGPGKSLPFILADAGYDVWMGNARGNTWSRQHSRYDPDTEPELFWDFSFHEIGYFDLPAIIDYILKLSNKKNLYYIGHSQGTTVYYVATSLKPEYNKKVKLMISLSPGASIKYTESPMFQFITNSEQQLQWLRDTLGMHEVFSSSKTLSSIGEWLCDYFSPLSGFCGRVLQSWAGPTELLNNTLLPIIIGNSPAGASMKQLLHVSQVGSSERFQQYDYGTEENYLRYGQTTPPLYQLENISAPVAVLYASNDTVVVVKDAEETIRQLPNVVYTKLIEGYNHLDFLWATNAETMVYKPILELLKLY